MNVDFVVVGLGLGTLAILTGVLLFSWAAGRWEREAKQAMLPAEVSYDRAMAASRRGAGQAFIGAGVAVLIATVGALAGSLDDQTGAFLVTTAATVAGCGLLVWAYLHRSRNPLPQRPRTFAAVTEQGVNETGRARRVALPAMQVRPGQQMVNAAQDDEDPGELPGFVDSSPEATVNAAATREAAEPVVDALSSTSSDSVPLAEEASEPQDESDREPEGLEANRLARQEFLDREGSGPETAPGDDGEGRSETVRSQNEPALNGVKDAPFALQEEDLVGDWEVRRDRKI